MRIGIKPTVDVVFKKIFGSPSHEAVTRDFLNSLLPLVGVHEVSRLTILNPFRLAEFAGDKEVTVDIHATDADEREIQIEMQIRQDKAISSRMLDNWARLYSAQLNKGDDYRKHRPMLVLWVLGETFFEDAECVHAFRTCDRRIGTILCADLLIITVELPKRQGLSGPSSLTKFETPLEEWMWFLANGAEIDLRKASYRSLRDEIREAVEIMDVFSKQAKARYTYERRMDWERTMNAWKADSRQEGLEEGRAEGLKAGIAEGIAKGIAEGKAKGIAEGIAEGKAKGLAEGKRVQALEVARRLKALGLSDDMIVTATGIEKDELGSLGA